jgi:hypothetical protein
VPNQSHSVIAAEAAEVPAFFLSVPV